MLKKVWDWIGQPPIGDEPKIETIERDGEIFTYFDGNDDKADRWWLKDSSGTIVIDGSSINGRPQLYVTNCEYKGCGADDAYRRYLKKVQIDEREAEYDKLVDAVHQSQDVMRAITYQRELQEKQKRIAVKLAANIPYGPNQFNLAMKEAEKYL